jgi:hypothetical protein
MRNTALWAGVISVLMAGLSGCQSGPDVVRGQSPNEMPLYAPQGDPSMQAACPPGAYGDPSMGGAACDPALGGAYCGKQWHHMKYCVPGGLSYPPPNSMPAVVQYPYYTLRGPTDFFYTGE